MYFTESLILSENFVDGTIVDNFFQGIEHAVANVDHDDTHSCDLMVRYCGHHDSVLTGPTSTGLK